MSRRFQAHPMTAEQQAPRTEAGPKVYYCQTCGKTRLVEWLHRECPPDYRPEQEAARPLPEPQPAVRQAAWALLTAIDNPHLGVTEHAANNLRAALGALPATSLIEHLVRSQPPDPATAHEVK